MVETPEGYALEETDKEIDQLRSEMKELRVELEYYHQHFPDVDQLCRELEDATANVEQWKKIAEGREHVMTSYRLGQFGCSADKGLTMIDEAYEELVKIKARRIRQKESG